MTLSGSLVDFPLEGVLRLLATTRKTGIVEIGAEGDVGVLEIQDGALVGARYGDDTGLEALSVILAISEGAFSFRPSEIGTPNLSGSMEELFAQAAQDRERVISIRTAIPNDQLRFALSERALSGAQITISPQHWRLLLRVDGRRDVGQLAAALGQGRTTTRRQLQDLLAAGLVDTVEVAPAPEIAAPPEPVRREAPVVEAPPVVRASPPEPAPAPQVEAPPAPATPVAEPAPPAPAAAHATPPPAAPAAPAAPRAAAPAQNFWEKPTGVQPPTEDLSELLQARLAALEKPGARAQSQPSPQDFWNQVQPPAEPPVLRPKPAVESAPVEQRAEPAAAASAPPPAASPAPAAPAPTPESFTAQDDRLSAILSSAPPATRPSPSAPPPPIVQPSVSHWLPPDTTAPILEVETPASAPKEEKKRGGGFFGFGRKKEAPPQIEPPSFAASAAAAPGAVSGSSIGMLASFANALISEYNSGQYGKGRLDERMNVRLRIVDEQADPLDRMLPVQDDRLDVAAVDRDFRPDQAGPYLATLVRQIVEDAERLFGKDKAKKGYRAAIKNALGGDESVLREPFIAPNLPRL